MSRQRYRIFFSREKFGGYTHTLVLDEVCFFFSAMRKKKQVVFFPWKSLDATHSPRKKSAYTKDEITLVERDKNIVFYRPLPLVKSTTKKSEFTPVNQRKRGKKKLFTCFFFPKKLPQEMFFFFPRKSLNCTHTLNVRGRRKKQVKKKKHNSY